MYIYSPYFFAFKFVEKFVLPALKYKKTLETTLPALKY